MLNAETFVKLTVICPADGQPAELTTDDNNQSFHCSHQGQVHHCLDSCGAREVLESLVRGQTCEL